MTRSTDRHRPLAARWLTALLLLAVLAVSLAVPPAPRAGGGGAGAAALDLPGKELIDKFAGIGSLWDYLHAHPWLQALIFIPTASNTHSVARDVLFEDPLHLLMEEYPDADADADAGDEESASQKLAEGASFFGRLFASGGGEDARQARERERRTLVQMRIERAEQLLQKWQGHASTAKMTAITTMSIVLVAIKLPFVAVTGALFTAANVGLYYITNARREKLYYDLYDQSSTSHYMFVADGDAGARQQPARADDPEGTLGVNASDAALVYRVLSQRGIGNMPSYNAFQALAQSMQRARGMLRNSAPLSEFDDLLSHQRRQDADGGGGDGDFVDLLQPSIYYGYLMDAVVVTVPVVAILSVLTGNARLVLLLVLAEAAALVAVQRLQRMHDALAADMVRRQLQYELFMRRCRIYEYDVSERVGMTLGGALSGLLAGIASLLPAIAQRPAAQMDEALNPGAAFGAQSLLADHDGQVVFDRQTGIILSSERCINLIIAMHQRPSLYVQHHAVTSYLSILLSPVYIVGLGNCVALAVTGMLLWWLFRKAGGPAAPAPAVASAPPAPQLMPPAHGAQPDAAGAAG